MVAHAFLVDIEHLFNKSVIISPYNHEVSNKEAKYGIGFPNVGKSSLTNMPKWAKVCHRISLGSPF